MMRDMDLAVQQLGPLPEIKIVRSPSDNSHYEYLKQKRQKGEN